MKLKIKQTKLSIEPLEVFANLVDNYDNCFLLETLADEYQPQTTSQSYIGVSPEHIFAAKDGEFYIDSQSQTGEPPFEQLRRQMKFDKDLPGGYLGGLVGYFSHEAIHYMEPTLEFKYPRDFFDFEFARYNDGLIFHPGKSPEYFYYEEDRASLYQHKANGTKDNLEINFKTAAKGYPAYQHMIDKASTDIQNGRVFQVVLANKYDYEYQGNLLALYRELRRINPSPFMFFLKFGDVITLGASPELLVRTDPGDKVFLEALAGTIRRGKNDDEDSELAKQLLADEKEIAEHSMLVDLARNDIGRVSQVGSVRIEDLMYIKKLSHVQHISSIVSGQLDAGHDAFDALAASFPAGTLSGAPKIEAIKMIKELEAYERGPYGGTIGYFGFNGDSMHAVNIRSVSAVGEKLFLHSGSGIVYDSVAEREYQEVSEKKNAMDEAMKSFLAGDKP